MLANAQMMPIRTVWPIISTETGEGNPGTIRNACWVRWRATSHDADRAGNDRHQPRRGIRTEHDLECVEGAGERRGKCGADGPCRPAGDQQAHVAPARGQPLADLGAKAAQIWV